MNFDNGQGLKFGLSGYGQGFDTSAAGNMCQFQYVGLDGMAGTIKPGQAMPSMPPDHAGSIGHHYRNMNVRHPQGSPVQNAFPIGVNISMATSAQFNTMQPLDSFAMHQGYPGNPRPDMHYKIFNNWIGPPAQGNVLQGHSQPPRQQGQPQGQVPQNQGQGQGPASLPSFGHLWSHFQQQQMQKQQALHQQEPPQQQQQQQQKQQQHFIGNQQLQNYPSTVALIPNVPNNSINLQRGQKVSYQYSTQNLGVVTQARVGPSFPTEVTQLVAGSNQPVGCGENQISLVVAAASNLAACSTSAASGLVVSAGTTPVTNTTTTVTMTTCSTTPVTTTATSHSGVLVSSVGPVQAQSSSTEEIVEKNQVEMSTEQCGRSAGKLPVSKSGDGSFQIVKVPFGWRRTTEDGEVIYYSPSNTRLTSYHEVCKYLVSDGTCKCGIECPLQVEKVFNFDPFVNGKLWTVDDVSTEDLTKLCIHKRKIIAMATFQRSQAIPGGILGPSPVIHSRAKPGNSRSKRESKPRKKLKNKGNATPYDGLLVSQLLAQRTNSPQVLNHKAPQGLSMKNVVGDMQFSPPNHLTCNVMSNLGANTKLHHHQSAEVGDLGSPLSGDLLRDPMDDLGPITCQVPAKLDFSAGCVLNNPTHRIVNSAVGAHDVGQVVFPAKNLSPQGPFSPDHLKNQQMMLQQHSPVQCVPASPSFVTNVPNHMYGPNVPQHFQVPLNLQQQQQPGGMMFQSLMQVQNASGQQVPNPQMFEQSGMQANPVHAGPHQQNLMFNSLYPQLSDLTWLDSGKPKTKRPRSKKDKQKLNSILDRTSPCPNVDVRHLPSEASCGTKSSVSFLENPSAFLAQQTALVRSSLNSSQLNMFHKPPPSNPSDTSSACVNTKTTSVCVKKTICSSVLTEPLGIDSVERTENADTAVSPDAPDSISSGNNKTDKKEPPCENVENKKLPKDQVVEVSTANENVASTSVTQSDNKSKSSMTTVSGNAKSKSPKPKARSNIVRHLNQTSTKPQPPATSGSAITVTGVVESPVFTTSSLHVGGLPHASQPGTGDFPASSLLSAAAKAQGSQASPLGVVLGSPLQVNPGLPVNVSPDMTGVGSASLQDLMGKSGLSSLDQLCLSFGSGGLAPVMIPQNNILTGAMPGFVNNPALQGLPVNMCLPLGQPVMNSGVLNLAQNLMFGGLDPKLVSQTQQSDKCVSVNSSKSSSSDSTKDSGSQSAGLVTVQTDSIHMSNVAETDAKNLACTSAAVHQVSSASNSQLLNNQFPFVTMNTPMPPMSLPVVTNVTNSLSQVIPAVGMPQTILNQHPLAHLLSTMAVPAMNNSVVLTNPATQSCAQNIAYLGLPVSGVTSASTATDKSDDRIGADGNAERTAGPQSLVMSDKHEASEQVSVDAQLQQETPNLVLFPNLSMPMVQVLDGGSMIAAMDKLGTVPQVMLPGTILDSQSQLCQSHPCASLPLNLLQLQQMWNNIGGAGVPSVGALQLQQLQTLQLQLLLQQLHVQGMQNLVNQMNLHEAVVPESGGMSSSSSPADAEDEVDSEEQAVQDSAEEGDQDDDQSSMEGSTQDENVVDQEEGLLQDVCEDTSESVVNQKDSLRCKASVLQQQQQPSIRKTSEEKSVRIRSCVSNTKPYVCTHSDSSGTKLKFVSVSCSSSVSSHSSSMKRSRTVTSRDSDSVKSLSSNKKQSKKQKYSSEKALPLCYDRVNYECGRTFTQDVSDDFTKSSPDRQSDSSTSVFEEESEKHKLARESFKNQIMGKKNLLKSESSEDLSSGISGKRTSDSSDTSVNDQALSDSGFTDCSDPSANESHERLPHHGEESTDKSDTGEATEEDDLPLGDLKRKAKKRLYPDDQDVDMDENLEEYSIECNSLQEIPCTGDLVWGQIRGFPLWPGKLVPESAAADVDLGPDYGEGIATVIVMWYGDHTFTRVEPERLKSWREGLIAHHKTRRRRKGRKMNSNLEAAIQEAMKDVSVESLPVLRNWRGRSNKKKKT
ncbi:uncharacterized protein LOC121384943 [Gigantopelta aegis]|uniref:uncharacterized protein LOC121384943 n=1 Tax=Gigantopelta aegis TaxID=1735272 RepID=UPI001B889B8C|nr:uncharacterized protein LOC121384943 [Gigantopelta aegis]